MNVSKQVENEEKWKLYLILVWLVIFLSLIPFLDYILIFQSFHLRQLSIFWEGSIYVVLVRYPVLLTFSILLSYLFCIFLFKTQISLKYKFKDYNLKKLQYLSISGFIFCNIFILPLYIWVVCFICFTDYGYFSIVSFQFIDFMLFFVIFSFVRNYYKTKRIQYIYRSFIAVPLVFILFFLAIFYRG